MDQQAPHNLPFEPEPPAPPTPPPAPKVELPPASPIVPPPAQFLSGEPSVQSMRPSTRGTPKQPEDMFSGLDTAASGKPQNRVLPLVDPLAPHHASYGKYILLVCCLVAGLGIIGGALWYFAIHRPAQQAEREVAEAPVTPTPVSTEPIDAMEVSPIPTTPTPTPAASSPTPLIQDAAPLPTGSILPPATSDPVVTPPPGVTIPPPTSVRSSPPPAASSSTTIVFTDTDRDGLSDTREQELGTDANNADSDADTLSDGDEVLKYGTNPLKMDTDADTYADGLEVKGGFDPRGPGRCAKPDCVQ